MAKNSVQNSKIVLIGGGTGSFTLLQELKNLTPNITSLVNMSDDGGSTGKLKDELGVLPPGDVRQCLVALSNTPKLRELFDYRFGKGSLAGHSVGNIILSGLELQYGDFAKAIKVASVVLNITGQVIPITLNKHQLIMKDGDKIIKGETAIARHTIDLPHPILTHLPKVNINPEANDALLRANLVVIAPGNLYGSLLPAIAVDGVKQTIAKTKAKVVMISNLVTKPHQTDGWHVVDYVKEVERYLGIGSVDFVLYNEEVPSKDLLKRYATDGEFPVAIEVNKFRSITAKPIGAKLVAGRTAKQDPNDKAIKRTLIRHDAKEVGRQLELILSDLSNYSG